MSLQVRIHDSKNGQCAAVENHALVTVSEPYPPFGKSRTYIHRQYMTADGTSTGSSDMKVVGTLAAPIKFWVPAGKNDDRYITNISFVLSGPGAILSDFCAATALTNGCRIYYERERGIKEIHEGLKTNFDFIRLCLGNPAFGDAASAFRAPNVSGGSEAYIPVMDLTKIMPPYGIKLDAGSNQRLVLEVRDNLTVVGITAVNVIVYGFDREP